LNGSDFINYRNEQQGFPRLDSPRDNSEVSDVSGDFDNMAINATSDTSDEDAIESLSDESEDDSDYGKEDPPKKENGKDGDSDDSDL